MFKINFIARALVSLTILAFDLGSLQAQSGSRQYAVVGTSYKMGTITALGKDKIQFKSGNSTQVLSANEVMEYGTQDGQIFNSFNIGGKRKFVERLSSGKISLFNYDSVYYLKTEKDTTLITPQNYISTLRSKLDCNKPKFIPYKKRALRSLANQYNKKGCQIRFLSYSKFGIAAGISPYTIKANFGDLAPGNYTGSGVTGTAGIFADLAIFKQKKVLLATELYYLSANANFTDYGSSISTDFKSILLPVGLKWYCAWPFYLKAGTVISRNTTRTPAFFDMKTSNISFGVQLGAGADFPVSNSNHIQFELKYFDLNNKGNDAVTVDCSSTTFLVGITF